MFVIWVLAWPQACQYGDSTQKWLVAWLWLTRHGPTRRNDDGTSVTLLTLHRASHGCNIILARHRHRSGSSCLAQSCDYPNILFWYDYFIHTMSVLQDNWTFSNMKISVIFLGWNKLWIMWDFSFFYDISLKKERKKGRKKGKGEGKLVKHCIEEGKGRIYIYI